MDSKNKGLLVVISGPSGSGKDTVIAELKKRDLPVKQSVSATTRAMRDGEKDGVDYYFTDVTSFEEQIAEDYFLEYVKYGDNYYGTPKKACFDLMDGGVDVILKIEVEGAGNIRKKYPQTVSIFIIPPSLDILAQRLRARGTETEESYKKRLAIAGEEIKRAGEYGYVVINDDLDKCVDDICCILSAEKSRYENMKNYVESF